jgi:hypothetical protein
MRSWATVRAMRWMAFADTSRDTIQALSALNTPGFGAGSGNRLRDTIMACSNGTMLTE